MPALTVTTAWQSRTLAANELWQCWSGVLQIDTEAVEANFNTRVKMGQSSNVMAVAVMNDGKVLFAQKEVKVTLGGCGG